MFTHISVFFTLSLDVPGSVLSPKREAEGSEGITQLLYLTVSKNLLANCDYLPIYLHVATPTSVCIKCSTGILLFFSFIIVFSAHLTPFSVNTLGMPRQQGRLREFVGP